MEYAPPVPRKLKSCDHTWVPLLKPLTRRVDTLPQPPPSSIDCSEKSEVLEKLADAAPDTATTCVAVGWYDEYFCW